MRTKERGTSERDIDRMQNEGGGSSTLYDLVDRHLEEETPQDTDILPEKQSSEENGAPDDKTKTA